MGNLNFFNKNKEDINYEGEKNNGLSYGKWGNGKQVSFIGSLLMALMIIAVGLGVFFAFSTPKEAKAHVTNTTLKSDEDGYYEEYDFYYVYNGKTYTGSGNANLGNNGSFKIKVGDTKTVYLHIYSNSDYELSNKNHYAYLSLFFFGGFGLFILINTIRVFIKRRKKLAEIGDANGDGKVNGKDIEYAEGNIQEINIGSEGFNKIKHIDDNK